MARHSNWEPIPSLLQLVAQALRARKIVGPSGCAPEEVKHLGEVVAAPLAPSWEALLLEHDGLPLPDGRIFSAKETVSLRESSPEGLVPVAELRGSLFCLDPSFGDADGDWPVVEIIGGQMEPAGTTLLRFCLARLADDAAGRAEADPGHSDHWLDWAGGLEEAGKHEEAWQVLRRGLLSAHPVGAALLVAMAETELRCNREDDAVVHFEMALSAEVYSTRDEGARYDAAAERLAVARARSDEEAVKRCLGVLGDGVLATASLWLDECVRALGRGQPEWTRHAARVVLSLVPDDKDAPRFLEPTNHLREAARMACDAREKAASEDHSDHEEAHKLLERAQARAGLGIILLQFARLLTREGDRRAVEISRRAVKANPALLDAHFQLGDAHLIVGDSEGAEKALRHVVDRDPSYGLAWSKLALALLNQSKPEAALELAQRAVGKTEDPFFTCSVLGDCLVELGRFEEAAQAYEEALKTYDGDHWTLHQAANTYAEIGDYPRAAQLYQRAMDRDNESCHQTLVDFGQLKRRMGRVGEAVRLLKRAVKAAPEESVYREMLKEAQRELGTAPN